MFPCFLCLPWLLAAHHGKHGKHGRGGKKKAAGDSWNKAPVSPDISNVIGSFAPWRNKMAGEKTNAIRMNWLFEIEPYSRPQTATLADIRNNLRLKKNLKRAVEREVAPLSLIEAIRAGIRA